MNHIYAKGQINIMTAIVGALGMLGTAALTSWATVSRETSDIRTEVRIIEERENNHYAELRRDTEEIKMILRAAPWNKIK